MSPPGWLSGLSQMDPKPQDPNPGTTAHMHIPRYRETLPPMRSLDSRRWVFLREGPGGLTAQGPQGPFLPWIHRRAPQPPPKKSQHELSKEAAHFCKLEQVGALLATHPHLEEALSAELLLKVLEVLDPERKLEDTWAHCQNTRRRTGEPARLLKKCPKQVCLGPPRKIPVSHSGQWHYEGKPRNMDLPQEDGPTLHESVRQEVSDFCKWTATFGDLNINEEFIRKQFDTDHQSKLSSDVPHAMRCSQVPLGLEKRVALNKLQEAGSFQKPNQERQSQRPQGPYRPRQVKTKYGAWYPSTGLWKRRGAGGALVDPSVSRKARDEHFEKEP